MRLGYPMKRLVTLAALALCGSFVATAGEADAADLPRGVKSGIKVDRFSMHSQEGVRWAADGIHGAKSDVLAESFGVSNSKVVAAMKDRLRNKVAVRANADPENMRLESVRDLNKAGADFRPLGGDALRKGTYRIKLNPRKVHAKAVHFDDRSWLSTASLMWDSTTIDATAVTSGKSAAAARAITEAAFQADTPALEHSAAEGRRAGVLLNYPSMKIDYLTKGMHDLVGGAKRELIVGMKAIDSPDFAKRLSETAARGVKVTLVTRASKLSPKARAALSSNVRLVNDPYDVLHGNFMVADGDVGLFGSAHATKRALGKGRARDSYEMGYVVTDAHAIAKMHDAALAFVRLGEE